MKIRAFIILICCMPLFIGHAQDLTPSCSRYRAFTDSSTNKLVFIEAQEMPKFADSNLTFEKFFLENFDFNTVDCHQPEIEISFIVQPDGSITNKKIENPLDCDISKQVMIVLDKIPMMIPGKIKGASVPVQMKHRITMPLQLKF